MKIKRRASISHVRAPLPRRTFLLLTLLTSSLATGVAAQEPIIEEQVALDAEGRLLRIDAELAASLGLFGDLTNLREVLLFRTADGYVLEIARRQGGVVVRERRAMGEGEVAQLRADVSRRLAERAPSALVDRSGRYLLLATTTAAGLAFYGWAIPTALDVDDEKGFVGLYMLSSAASFFGPWGWSSNRPVSLGMANGGFWGVTRGIVHGIALHRVIAGEEPDFLVCPGDDFQCFERADDERDRWARGRVASALAGSLLEGFGAIAWARSAGATAGDAHLLGVSSDLGAASAVGLGVVMGFEDDASALWGLSLGGAAAGLGAGAVLRKHRDHSWGDAEVFRTAGLLGAYTGVTLADLTGADDAQVVAAIVLAGEAAGLVLGDRLVRRRELGAGQALLVDLGTVAGGLLGLGFAVLVSDDASDGTLPLLLSTGGAVLGFTATLGSVGDSESDRLRTPPDSGNGRLDFDLVPFPHGARGGNTSLPPLAVRLRYRF